MKPKNKRFTREEKIRLLEDYEASGMSPKDYAQLKGLGLSTLNRWSLKLRGPLRERGKAASSVTNTMPSSNSETFSEDKRREDNKQDALLASLASTSSISFIDITSQVRKVSPQVIQNLEPCEIEILLPSGIILKLEKVPFHHIWPQVVEWVRELR
jgi:transposase-like protein